MRQLACLHPSSNQMLLLALVLMGGIRVDVTDAEPDERVVFFEKLWQIEIFLPS